MFLKLERHAAKNFTSAAGKIRTLFQVMGLKYGHFCAVTLNSSKTFSIVQHIVQFCIYYITAGVKSHLIIANSAELYSTLLRQPFKQLAFPCRKIGLSNFCFAEREAPYSLPEN
jgi:hypothetical protein